MPKMNDILLVRIVGMQKTEILEDIGFNVDSNGFLLRGGERVKTRDLSSYVRADDVKAVFPGSLEVITDLSEAEDYFKEY